MIFNSIEFLIFLPVVFLLFWVCSSKFRWVILLIASYFFYMYWNWKLVFLIFFTTVISYSAGLSLNYVKDNKLRKAIVVSAMVICLGVLVFFKYFSFLYEIFNDILTMFNQKAYGGIFEIMLPVGISFYTFQTASYVIDVYKGTIRAEKHFGYYMLYVSYFPQLVAGPIERPGDLIPQLKCNAKIKEINFVRAARFILVGFFKKIAVADTIGLFVNSVYNNVADSSGLLLCFATVLFSVQIFCDFSGYTDIAIGCACLFGVELTENFNSPYCAKSIKEFWGRWHITLSSWLRDYVYFPLGGSRVKKTRWAFNILIVFLISGLWHGASYNYVVWGLIHAVFQVFGNLTLNVRNTFWDKVKIGRNSRVLAALRVASTFLLVSFAWIFFRANSLNDAVLVITKIFTAFSFDFITFTSWFKSQYSMIFAILYVILCISILFEVEYLKNLDKPRLLGTNYCVSRFEHVRLLLYVVMLWCVLGSWIFLQASEVGSSFIYFQF